MLEVNQILQQGRYRILDQNGQDASYQAYDSFLQANVALREVNENGDYAKRAKNLAQIKHDSLLNVYDYFSEIDRQYLVLETVEGDSISNLIEQNKSLCSLADFVRWADQLLDAVVCLQNRIPPIIHSEIRPQNIKLTANNHLKLSIFNFTGQNGQHPDLVELAFSPLEQFWKNLDSSSKQFILRSFDEKSERLLEHPLDVRSDVYSIGATLYYLATGKRPVDALERTIDVVEGKADPLEHLHKINPAIPPEIGSIVMKALEIKRENRFSSALVMQSILRGTVFRLKPIVGEQVVASLRAVQVVEQIQVKPSEIEEQESFIEEPRLPKLIEEPAFEVEPPPFEAEKISEEEIAEPEQVVVEENLPIGEPDLEIDYAVETDDSDIPVKQKGGLHRMAAFVVGLIVLGGIGWGIWTMNSSDSTPLGETAPPQNVVLPTVTETPKTEVEATPAPTAAPTPEPSLVPTPEVTPTATPSELRTVEKPVMKNKPPVAVPTPLPVKKKVEIPKPTATPKKITVDDLINDN